MGQAHHIERLMIIGNFALLGGNRRPVMPYRVWDRQFGADRDVTQAQAAAFLAKLDEDRSGLSVLEAATG